jgi:hypothetical protein
MGIEELYRGGIMIPEKHEAAPFPYNFGAFIRLGTIPDNIPKANYFIDRFFPDILKDRLKSFEIGMDIRDKGESHGFTRSP